MEKLTRTIKEKAQALRLPVWLVRSVALAAFAGIVSGLTLAAAVHFNIVVMPTNQAEEVVADVSEEDKAWAENITTDDESDEDDGEIEIPESLRAEYVPDSEMVEVLNQLGLIETIFPVVPKEVAQTSETPFDRDAVLDDFDNRISPEFKIPAGLKGRVGFWFDVYTKYDSNRRIIHHARHPQIIFKVVDTTYIINSDTPRRLWMRREKADKIVKEEAQIVRATLRKLANRKTLKDLSESEQMVADALAPLGGDVRKQAMLALHEVRVQTGQRNFFASGLTQSTRYLNTMEAIFKRYKLPTELTRIPFVESSFNDHATSKVGASGIWQFMGNTGRKFMLVDGVIDERRSPLKATEAAARLLKENHMILYRSWPLAITAWNHGPGGIRKASQKAGSRDLAQIIARYRSRSFDFASSNFYSEFLAALHAEKYSHEIFENLDREEHLDLQLVKLSRSVRVSDLLRVSKLSLTDFLTINPELKTAARRNLLLPRGFRLHVPQHLLRDIESLFAAVDDVAPKRST